MYFKLYKTKEDTIKEWSRQLNIINNGNYPLYETVSKTLSHWKETLNNNLGMNTFELKENEESTISGWKDKLNYIYNK